MNLRFSLVILLPVSWLVLTLKYTKHDSFITVRNMTFVSILPFISIIVVWTNPFHHLFFKGIEIMRKGPINILLPDTSIWFWVHTSYSYLLMLTGILLLLFMFVQQPKVYRRQTGFFLVGAFVPWVGNILSVFKIISLPYPDITPFSLLITGFLFFWALFRYKLFDLIPIARYAIIESMKDPVLVLDDQNRVVDINPAASDFFCKNNHDIIGQNAGLALANFPLLIERFKDVVETNEKIKFDYSGSVKHFEIRISPIYDSKNRFCGRLAVLRDITDLEVTIEQLTVSREAAEAANKAKGQFWANMSHEIRTPMNAIIGVSDILSCSELSQEQREHLDMLKFSANSLLKIINDILDFSKIEAGKLKFETINFDLKNLLMQTVKSFAIQAEKKSLLFKYTLPQDIPSHVSGDPTRLSQVLSNLISNAIKFTQVGAVMVDTLNKGVNDGICLLEFSVSDTGIGIPENKISTLFERFNQVDISNTRKYGGTGLGLAIVKNLIEMMGGTLSVESTQGVGSKFSFIIPLRIVDKSIEEVYTAKEATSSIISPPRELQILLAEDNIINQKLMVKLLQKFDCRVDIADNGLLAVENVKKCSYDLILMDVQMPEMDGLAATRLIRSLERHHVGPRIPIVALTANAMDGDMEKCLASGMDDFLAKPVKMDTLRNIIEKYTQQLAYNAATAP